MAAEKATRTKPIAEAGIEPSPIAMRDLLSYKLHRTANSLTRSAAVRYREQFGISMAEWRTIAILGGDAPVSHNQLAREANLDKGQISRIVTALVERGLVSRKPSPDHGRIEFLSLTRQGQLQYQKLMQVAKERDEAFLASLSKDEIRALERTMDKLNEIARTMIYGNTGKDTQRKPKR